MLILIIWLISFALTCALFGINGFPCNLGNSILALIPGINTLIAIKLLIESLRDLDVNIFKDMKDTVNTIFKK